MGTEALVVTSMKLCCLWCGAHGPTELLGQTTLFLLLNAKERRWWLEVMIAVEKKKEAHHGFKHAQSSPAWGHHPLQRKECAFGKQQGVGVFSFPFSYKNDKFRASTVWMLVYIQWNSHPLVLLVHLSKCWNLHYRRSPVQVFSKCEMLHSLHRLVGLLLDSVLSLGEEGREEAICLSRFLWNCY